jgi:hypothetical protein
MPSVVSDVSAACAMVEPAERNSGEPVAVCRPARKPSTTPWLLVQVAPPLLTPEEVSPSLIRPLAANHCHSRCAQVR